MRGRLLPALRRVAAGPGADALPAVLEAALSLSGAPPAALLAELLDECGPAIAAACAPRVRRANIHRVRCGISGERQQ